MAQEWTSELTATVMAEISDLFGPPAVLSSENVASYNKMLAGFLEWIRPYDVIERMFIKDLVEFEWEVRRYRRHLILLVEHGYRKSLEAQVQQRKELQEGKNKLARASTNNDVETEANIDQDLQDKALETYCDAEDVLDRAERELGHARAMQGRVDYHERLNCLLQIALRNRQSVLDQLELYREGLGVRLRALCEKVIDAECQELGKETDSLANGSDATVLLTEAPGIAPPE